jgi:hypothetical protein
MEVCCRCCAHGLDVRVSSFWLVTVDPSQKQKTQQKNKRLWRVIALYSKYSRRGWVVVMVDKLWMKCCFETPPIDICIFLLHQIYRASNHIGRFDCGRPCWTLDHHVKLPKNAKPASFLARPGMKINDGACQQAETMRSIEAEPNLDAIAAETELSFGVGCCRRRTKKLRWCCTEG